MVTVLIRGFVKRVNNFTHNFISPCLLYKLKDWTGDGQIETHFAIKSLVPIIYLLK